MSLARPSHAKRQRSTTKNSSPETGNGALLSFRKQGIRLYCATCLQVMDIQRVTGVDQLSASARYDLELSCGHSRELVLEVKRSASQLARFNEIDDVAEVDVCDQTRTEQLDGDQPTIAMLMNATNPPTDEETT